MAKNQKCGSCGKVGHNVRGCDNAGTVVTALRAEIAELKAEIRGRMPTSGKNQNKLLSDEERGEFCPKVPERFGGRTKAAVVAKGARKPLRCNYCKVWLVSPYALKTHIGLGTREMRAALKH